MPSSAHNNRPDRCDQGITRNHEPGRDLEHEKISRRGTKRWLVAYPRLLPLGIFFLIAAITLVSIMAIEASVGRRLNAQLDARAVAIASALERRANASSAYLRAGAALVSTMDEVPEDEFNRFVSELRLDSDYRGAEGIGWAQVVRPADTADFMAKMVEAHGPGYQIYSSDSPSRSFVVPVTYLQPETERSRRALGYDMYSNAARRRAMDAAVENERPTASDPVVLQQENGQQSPGFLIYMPVFEGRAGGRRLKGFVYSPFNASDFLASALELADAGSFGVSLYDRGADGSNALLASTAAGEPLEEREQGEHSNLRNIMIAHNAASLVVSREEGPLLSGLSLATLIFGLLVASLLGLVVRLLTRQAQEDEASLEWFAEQASIRDSLTRELNHRVKNTLANVLSIIALTRRRAEDVADFADGLDGRIRALSATHDLLTHSDWGSTPITSVVEAELLPYVQCGEHELVMDGPDVELAPNDALSLGLAMHELATNATKYGSLSQTGGSLTVVWDYIDEKMVRLEWLERGGPPVPQERGRGFGTDLIERIVAHELHNPVELDFEPEGVRCAITISVRKPRPFSLRADGPAQVMQTGRKAQLALKMSQGMPTSTKH